MDSSLPIMQKNVNCEWYITNSLYPTIYFPPVALLQKGQHVETHSGL